MREAVNIAGVTFEAAYLSALIALVAAFLFLITPMIPPSLGGLR